jgi:pyruvate,orthophosphate dikinase
MAETWVYLACNAKAKLTDKLGCEPERADLKRLLGAKGASLVALVSTGAPVPPAFTITTEASVAYLNNRELPAGLWDQVVDAIRDLEDQTGKTFGKGPFPLLVSVTSGARVSMPGMMDNLVDLGLNDQTCVAMSELTEDARFSYDAYSRFISMFSDTVMGYARHPFEEKLYALKQREGAELDADLSLDGLKWLVEEYKRMYREKFGEAFPSDPYQQLKMTLKAAFDSWNSERAVAYREHEGIPHDWGTAANVMTRVFGNMAEKSAVVDLFSRDPATGARGLYGEWLPNARGEDLFYHFHPSLYRVTLEGSREWAEIYNISEEERKHDHPSLEEVMPEIYQALVGIVNRLERYYREMQEMVFTIERGQLWLLLSHTGKRSAHAAIRIAVDLAKEGLITREEAVMRISPQHIEVVLHPSFNPEVEKTLIAKGMNASPGAAVGIAVFDAQRAKEKADKGEDVILVRPATVPDDVPGLLASRGLLMQQGSATSNVAIVARSANLPAVVGCKAMVFDEEASRFTVGKIVVKEGDMISIDGSKGEVYLGAVPLIEAGFADAHLITLLNWADEIRKGVRAKT